MNSAELAARIAASIAEPLTWSELGRCALRLCVAALLGALIGIEREVRHKAAGLRTHILITMSSAAFVLFGLELGERTGGDATRIIQGVVVGVGFLGAGAIIRKPDSEEVHGLTTAAGIWTATAIGVATGAGWFLIAGLTTLITLVVVWGLSRFERR